MALCLTLAVPALVVPSSLCPRTSHPVTVQPACPKAAAGPSSVLPPAARSAKDNLSFAKRTVWSALLATLPLAISVPKAEAAVASALSTFPTTVNLIPDDLDAGAAGSPDALLMVGLVAAFSASYLVSATGGLGLGLAGGVATAGGAGRVAAPPEPRAGMMEWMAGAPLPTLDELRESCWMIGNDGLRDGRRKFLCFEPTNAGAYDCEADEEFSDFYGLPVYVCEM